MRTKPAPAVEVDYIGYVRTHLDAMDPPEWTRLAADSGVSTRTLYNLRHKKVDPAYSTVIKLYDLIKKGEQADIKAAP